MTSVALLSGGLDSTVAVALAQRTVGVELAITVDYRQRAAVAEMKAARAVADALGIKHRLVRLDFLAEVATSALIERSAQLPFLNDGQLDEVAGAARSAMQRVWVPNRNGLMIGIAASFAEALGAAEVVVGFNAEEAATFPDNSKEFLVRMSEALRLSTLSGVRVVSPTIDMDKADIVKAGYEAGAPMEHIWSCYLGGASHCWSCESCRRLRRALVRSGNLDRFGPAKEGDR